MVRCALPHRSGSEAWEARRAAPRNNKDTGSQVERSRAAARNRARSREVRTEEARMGRADTRPVRIGPADRSPVDTSADSRTPAAIAVGSALAAVPALVPVRLRPMVRCLEHAPTATP
jgi:hypothetical protein